MQVSTWPLVELAIALPLAATLIAIVAGRWAASVVFVFAPVMFILAALLCVAVAQRGAIHVAIGGWASPLGIGLGADGFSAVFVMTTAIIMGAVGVYARASFNTGAEVSAHGFTFWPLFYAMWVALNAIFLGRDLFNYYVALELLTLTAVGMVASGTTTAALRYLLFALMGSLAYLAGVVLVYTLVATLDVGLLATTLQPGTTRLLAGGLITAGLLVKTALFPFHAWLPPAHAGAPTPASALLSALVVKAAFFILVRVWFQAMPDAQSAWLLQTLGILGAAAVIYGSVLAMTQNRLKLIVAYSTVAQLGYLFFVFPLSEGSTFALPWSVGAWSGGVFHAISHAFAKAALFLAAGIVIEAFGHDRLGELHGAARALPMVYAAFGLAALSIMGLPPSGGFMAKYLILTSAFASGQIFYAIVMLAGGLLAAVYLFRPLNVAFSGTHTPHVVAVSKGRQAIPLVLALCAMLVGIASRIPFEFLQIGLPEALSGDSP